MAQENKNRFGIFSREFTPEQKRKLNKVGVIGLLCLLFLGVMYIIYSPSDEDKKKESEGAGLNKELPSANQKEMVTDKRGAYEMERIAEKKDDRQKTLHDFAKMLQVTNDTVNHGGMNEVVIISDENTVKGVKLDQDSYRQPSSNIASSANRYKELNGSVSGFYDTPRESEEMRKLKEELEQLKSDMDRKNTGNKYQDQLALMEKSYQMAAKYLPNSQQSNDASAEKIEKVPAVVGKKKSISTVRKMSESVVSALPQQMSDSVLLNEFSKERNYGFITAVGEKTSVRKNTIRACIDIDQIVENGKSVRFRLLEDVVADDQYIPKNSELTGHALFKGERLEITVNSIEYNETIINVELYVYDLDGQRGLNAPGSTEISTVKEIAGNMGATVGTSVNVTKSAGQQIVGDVSRGLIQGTSQYIQKKVKAEKIHLKGIYNVFLVSSEI